MNDHDAPIDAIPTAVVVEVPDYTWARKFTTGELIPLKGEWFRVGVVSVGEEATRTQGLALFRIKPTTANLKRADTRRRRDALHMKLVIGGRKD